MKCEVKTGARKCSRESEMTYYEHEVCETHWDMDCAGEINLKKIFDIDDPVLEQSGQHSLKTFGV